ncbi:MAG: hypothetical protein JO366_06440 [Methylobacteriaceae bacterium]|nr:hypothetical protein [Methylobacteriaceae bacterium]MBV9244434.1 hypothetical protein [Methylobacteriaceae bacterium]
MLPARDIDSIDFRPFFDMVVGVLFVLLILIGALMFFEQVQHSESAAGEEQQRKHEWQIEKADFLAWLAGHLREGEIDPQVDLANSAVVIPADKVLDLGADGLPDVLDRPANKLGRILALDLACVAAAENRGGSCPSFRLLRLNEAVAEVRTGTLPSRTPLPRERFAHLAASLLAAKVLKGSPDLLKLSGSYGEMIFKVTSALGVQAPVTSPIGGEIALKFNFVAP